jgi:hypothetical protein
MQGMDFSPLTSTQTLMQGYKQWLLEKTKRDLNNKIAFDPERQLALPRVQAFHTLFGG